MRNQQQKFPITIGPENQEGFTLIELLVICSIIALMSAVALIAFQSARSKGRDARRLSDMVQMNNGLELFFAQFRGYPTGTNGDPLGVTPTFTASLPVPPSANDGACASLDYPSPPAPANYSAANYYYFGTGPTYLGSDNTTLVASDYNYYFCLANKTDRYSAGIHIMTPTGVR